MKKPTSAVAPLKAIEEIAEKVDVPSGALFRYGNHKAKLSFDFINSLSRKQNGKLILVTAMTPTKFGEGKTTVTVGLGDALSYIGKKAMICVREPSLGPVFGMKGGGTGGGRAQVAPPDDINLHFNGDLHAITAAHNLLAAMIDNHIYWGNKTGLDLRRVTWGRVMDANDRALRDIVVSLGGVANGYPRSGSFDITAASEVMAIFCLANDLKDLRRRLGNIVIGETRGREMVTARDIKADGAMTALLKDALQPNLVQSFEGTPAFVHGGPFANIAHGCNSVLATKSALKLADYVVTEAGFGADLGAEKFLEIKCRTAGLEPSAAVIVSTIRALKFHAGVSLADTTKNDPKAVVKGMPNLARQIQNMKSFGLKVVVAINRFADDSDAEINTLVRECKKLGVTAVPCTHFSDGAPGAADLAHAVVKATSGKPPKLKYKYALNDSLEDKVRAVAQKIYRAKDIAVPAPAARRFADLQKAGWGKVPVCIAKTQYSFTVDPTALNAPTGHIVPVREVRLSAGAGFVVAVCGDMMTMPGLPSVPAAEHIAVDAKGNITGMS